MHSLVINSLEKELFTHLGESASCVTELVISGNPTMLHLLRQLSVQGLSKAPFQPVTLAYEEEQLSRYHVNYPPGFSAFVGADIVSGAEFLQIGRDKAFDLLIDLGTNGELLLMNHERGFATSTACGPVFDHILTGARYGSVCIHSIATCLKRNLIDKTGLLKEPLFSTGIRLDHNIVIRQENIRQFQLAKAAIFSGIQCLLRRAEITKEDVGRVYVTGGLGFYMDLRDAFTVKLLPSDWSSIIKVSENTSLSGAIRLLMAEEDEKAAIRSTYQSLIKRTTAFELANDPAFQDFYFQSMSF